ncbi:ABC-type multidrug transport system permease subunit [Paenibacillus amylolyticus]|uniref:ABC-type multidrug transport system permease subunit n=1 Tax=Paenibacillus amylolyticus TaxID=1451 RepID=A0AAP5H8C3_PAEAM|nr:DUF2569 domain-containing protein [Paenibacillus amylolyticus]MDR6726986.1 ABC-type multidrug transport system permease subunit [Paenibacillus amylolyticus]
MQPQIEEQKVDYRPLGISGLGGWLVLVQIGLYLTMIMVLVQLFQYSLTALNPGTWEILTSDQSSFYHPWWGAIIIFEVTYNVLFFIFSIVTLVMFYRKKSVFPRLMIIFYSMSLAVSIIDYLLLLQIPIARELEDGSGLTGIVRLVITCAIWIPYFIKSERVRNTFIR